jgi:hypothetical protein
MLTWTGDSIDLNCILLVVITLTLCNVLYIIFRILQTAEADYLTRKAKVEAIGEKQIDMSDRNACIEEHNFYRNEWRARKQKALDIVDMIAEGNGKSRKEMAVFTV